MDWTKAYSGIVIKVSQDKTKIKIKTQNGIIECENEGFRVGDEVMFIPDPSSNKPLRILPKDVALMKLALLEDEAYQIALATEFNTDIMEVKDDTDDDPRPISEEMLDKGFLETGEDAEEWYDFVNIEDVFDNIDWS